MFVQRFYLKKTCQWCLVHNDHYVDFETYLFKENIVFYKVICENCYNKAVQRNGTYHFMRYQCTTLQWESFVPKIQLN